MTSKLGIGQRKSQKRLEKYFQLNEMKKIYIYISRVMQLTTYLKGSL